MACVANCSLRETGLHIIIEFNTIITKEAIASNSSWTRAKEDVVIKAEGVGLASETKDDGCVLPLGAPARGRALVSDPPWVPPPGGKLL